MQALDTLSSAKLSNRNTKMLNRFFEIIGRRECYDDGSLKRNKFFNRSLGKIFRKSSHINTRLIESFIKTMIDGLYKDSIQKLKNTPPL